MDQDNIKIPPKTISSLYDEIDPTDVIYSKPYEAITIPDSQYIKQEEPNNFLKPTKTTPSGQLYEEICPNDVTYSEPYEILRRPGILDTNKRTADVVLRNRPLPLPNRGSMFVDSLTITENNLYSDDPMGDADAEGRRMSAGIFIVDNEAYNQII